MINFAWSPESDRVVLINTRGMNEAECTFFEVEGNTFQEIARSIEQTQQMKIVALAFAAIPHRHRRSLMWTRSAGIAQGKFHRRG